MIEQTSQNRLFSKPRNSSNSFRRWKTLLFLLSTSALLVPSLHLRAEMIRGIVENYSPQNQQATISLGKEDGVGKYDRGKIKLSSLDSPNAKFIGANITVISVEENSAVVSVREAPGIQVPITAGAEIILDTDSGLAQRSEEAKVIAAQQVEEARRLQQLEEARAEQARRQREAEEARAKQARLQREAEEARILEARRQQQAEAERIEQARLQAKPEAEVEQTDVALKPSPQEDGVELESEDYWDSQAEGAEDRDTGKLPADYLLAYTEAREQPSPESYYKFAQVLINYEIFDKASEWLEEAKARFPETVKVNNLYRLVASVEQGDIEAGQKILATTSLPPDPLTKDFKTYLHVNQGQWSEALSMSNTKTAASYNNNLIALYCRRPFTFDRDTNLPLGNCPLPHESFETAEEDYNSDEELTDFEQNERNKQAIAKLAREANATYPENPYLLNTLGFIALQSEDYETAYNYYQQLSKLLARDSKIPPRFQILKANADKYAINYAQNYDFLANSTDDLISQRSEQDSVTDAIIIGGVGNTVAEVLRDNVGPVGIAGGILSTFLSMNRSRSKAQGIEEERNSVLDRMHETFTEDMILVPTPPQLEASSLLKLTTKQTNRELAADLH